MSLDDDARRTLANTRRIVPRSAEPRIADPATHQRRWVNLTVAAEFLEMDRRAVNAYIDDGSLSVEWRGRRRKANVDELVRFKCWLRQRKAS